MLTEFELLKTYGTLLKTKTKTSENKTLHPLLRGEVVKYSILYWKLRRMF